MMEWRTGTMAQDGKARYQMAGDYRIFNTGEVYVCWHRNNIIGYRDTGAEARKLCEEHGRGK